MDQERIPPRLPVDKLTELERTVLDAARLGEPAGLLDRRVDVEELAVTDDPGLCVRAELIRDLLLGRHGELDPRGVLIAGVRVLGLLDLDRVTAVTGLALVGSALPDGFTCRHASLPELALDESLVSGVFAVGLLIEGGLFLRGAVVRSDGEAGGVRLSGAHIGGAAVFDGGELVNSSGPALSAEHLRTEGSLFLCATVARGNGEAGAVRLHSAHIGGQAVFDGAGLVNDSGPALNAEYLRTDGSLSLRTTVARGNGKWGAVRLHSARIGGQAVFDGAGLVNDSGPALNAEYLRTDGSLSLCTHVDDDGHRRNAVMRGRGDAGAVSLHSAHIGGQAVFEEAVIADSGDGPLIVLAEAQVDGLLFLPATVVCPQGRVEAGGRSCVASASRTVVVRGLVFPRLGGVSWREWLHLLVHHTPEYLPQPYQQLAAVERAAGHEGNARQVLIVQQEDLRRRAPEALGGRLARLRYRLWGWLGRYGYRAHRLVLALAAVLALAGGTGYTAGQITTGPGTDHHTAERVRPPLPADTTIPAGTPCSTVELIGLGIDRGLPLGVTGVRARCDLDTSTTAGQVFTIVLWVLQALLWALATLTVAAYTSLIRKPA
ncbi:hypothetical protein [Saccharothrix syringae]|uniref:hypothetical protein n=1 Tax=Saccharothrix syringae TaxID=103733 RepID=UPI001D1736CD|nr:hypothetical protein [Saccharothrix syringae]